MPLKFTVISLIHVHVCMHAHRPGKCRALLLACPPSSSLSAPAKTSYNVILLVVVGNVLPQGPDNNHAEDACKDRVGG